MESSDKLNEKEKIGLKLYKNFIDGIVAQKDCVESKWILEKNYPQTEDNKNINEFLKSLSLEQKQILAKMVQDARVSGIHDTLAYIDEMMNCQDLILSQNGNIYPNDYFESMHYDFICRSEGDEWSE